MLGFLSDCELAELYSSIRVAVVPLRFGAGVKGKVIEAIRNNVPVVTTPIGVEGIPEWDQVTFVAEGALDFSLKLVDVYENINRSASKMETYASWLESHFDKNVAKKILLEDFGPPRKNINFGRNQVVSSRYSL